MPSQRRNFFALTAPQIGDLTSINSQLYLPTCLSWSSILLYFFTHNHLLTKIFYHCYGIKKLDC
ncbi:MAG: hypothetical protein D3917_05850 [Candidatus Electrothrix sp. AX5]|nr:hypothetical protein [Candidatus Electrothrix sp. AX5]